MRGAAASEAQAAITYVQGNSTGLQTQQSTVSTTFSSAQSAGDLIVVKVTASDPTATVSVADSKGNTYVLASGPAVIAGDFAQSLYYAKNIVAAAAGTNTVTVTFSTAVWYPDVIATEYSGIDTANPLDVTKAATGFGTTADSGSATTTNANDLLIGASSGDVNATGAGTGYTSRVISSNGTIMEDRIVTSAGAYNATAPYSGSGSWVMQLAAFKAASGGGDTQAPSAPTGLTATTASSSQINLSWTASTDNVGVTGYLVERCAGASCSNFTQIASPTTTNYSDTGLSASTSYSYRVRATDAASNLSAYSSTASATTSASSTTTVRINTAGPAYTDSLGQAWSADTSYNAGSTFAFGAINIANTPDPTLFRTERWDDTTAPELQYSINVPNGTYYVRLYFSESYIDDTFTNSGIGQRLFSVDMEGTRRFTDIDVYSEAGGHTALVKGTSVTVSDGQLNIAFVHNVQNPFIDAIEVIGAAGDTTAPSVPGSLAASVASSTQINLTWTASTDNAGVATYLIERCQGSSCTTFTQVATATGLTYSDTGLTPSTAYRYRIRAQDAASNNSSYSSIATATTPASGDTQAPTAPSSLTATTPTTMVVNLSWTASTDNVAVTRYLIERCQGSGCSNFVQIGSSPTTSYSDTNRAASTSYSYRVRARDAIPNYSAYSSTVSATTLAADTTAPSTPTGLTATVASSSQINLSWTASTDNVGVTGYLLERCQGASCSTFAQIATPIATSYSDTGLTASTSYTYRIRATDNVANYSGYSSTASATTSGSSDTQAPTAPTGLTATTVSSSQVNVSWTASTDNVGVTGYLLERCSGASCTTFAQIATPTQTSYSDTGLTASTSYSYRVRATDAASNLSAYSGTASATTSASSDTQPPTAPTGLTATAVSGSQINLSWTASTDNVGVTGYLLERCSGASCTTFAQIATPTATTYSDTGLTSSTSYSYRVRAKDAANNLSAYSSTASATTQSPPTAPAGLTVTAVSATEIDIAWTASTGGSGGISYLIERCQGASCSSFAQVGTSATTTYFDAGLTAATSYSYRVRATDSASNLSSYSTTLTTSTLSAASCD